MSKVAAIQMTSSADVEANLKQAESLITKACDSGAQLIVLPEVFAKIGQSPKETIEIKEKFGQGPVQTFLSEQAKKNRIWLVGGSVPIICDQPDKALSTSFVFNDHGKCVAHYEKIHLFDVTVSNAETYQESATIAPGNNVVVIDTPFGKLGLAICYDVRFPELFKLLFKAGAEIIALPSAFTVPTGQTHWEILVRARAIDTFSYIIAAGQVGVHANIRRTYGHSMIVSPGGAVQSCLPYGPGVVMGEVSLSLLREMREKIPVLQHQRIGCDFKN